MYIFISREKTDSQFSEKVILTNGNWGSFTTVNGGPFLYLCASVGIYLDSSTSGSCYVVNLTVPIPPWNWPFRARYHR